MTNNTDTYMFTCIKHIYFQYYKRIKKNLVLQCLSNVVICIYLYLTLGHEKKFFRNKIWLNNVYPSININLQINHQT